MTKNISEKATEITDKIVNNTSMDKGNIIPINANDMIFLSEIYRHAPGQAKDFDAARKWLMKAVEKNDCTAIEMLALDYLNGNELFEKDIKKAICWFEKAAENGSPDAQVFLGLAHLLEIGVPFEPLTAMFWLKKAEERGSTDAKEVLDTFYEIDGDNKTENNFKKFEKETEHEL